MKPRTKESPPPEVPGSRMRPDPPDGRSYGERTARQFVELNRKPKRPRFAKM